MKRLIIQKNTLQNPKNKKNKSEIVSVRLTSERRKALVQYAINDDRTFSSLVNKIVGNWLKKQRKPDSWR